MRFDTRIVDRVVIDTNVFVSGTAIANTPPSQGLDLWRNGLFVLVTSPQLLAEVKDVFTRPEIMAFTGLSVGETQAFLQEIKRRSYVSKGEYHIEPLASNPADTVVLQAAVGFPIGMEQFWSLRNRATRLPQRS